MKSNKATNLGQRLVCYGIGAGAASLAASAEATVQYSGPLSVSGNSISFNMQPFSAMPGFNALTDFQLESFIPKGKAGINAPAATSGIAGSGNYASFLTSGDTIGSSLAFKTGYSYLTNGGVGNWHVGDHGFLGLTFLFNGMTVYGWADVTLNNVNGNSPGVFTLSGLAFEDSGAAIAAGATGSGNTVPETGNTLALLVIGAAGVLALKRRQAKA
jgi:hypothetical protein